MKKIFLTLVVCLFVVLAMANCGNSSKQLSDREILVKIYEAMNGPGWKGSLGRNWLSDRSIEVWEGVETNDEGRVIGLEIRGESISGLIPAEIGGLSELKELIIYSRNFDAPNVIPTEIGKLIKLKLLYLYAYTNSKQFRPEFPNLSTLVNLESLLLEGFSGAIPGNIAQLSKLRSLDIDGFEGEIPEEICALINLRELVLRAYNPPEGNIPKSIGNLSKLETLILDYDSKIEGGLQEPNVEFPEWIWNLINLERLSVHSLSNTGGPIPGDKVAKMIHLERIEITNCGITGTIPAELFASGKLSNLEMYKNKLTGSIPTKIGNCHKLYTVRLDQNQLTGKIPKELAKCEKLTTCDLSGNHLSQEIPEALKVHPNFGDFEF